MNRSATALGLAVPLRMGRLPLRCGNFRNNKPQSRATNAFKSGPLVCHYGFSQCGPDKNGEERDKTQMGAYYRRRNEKGAGPENQPSLCTVATALHDGYKTSVLDLDLPPAHIRAITSTIAKFIPSQALS